MTMPKHCLSARLYLNINPRFSRLFATKPSDMDLKFMDFSEIEKMSKQENEPHTVLSPTIPKTKQAGYVTANRNKLQNLINKQFKEKEKGKLDHHLDPNSPKYLNKIRKEKWFKKNNIKIYGKFSGRYAGMIKNCRDCNEIMYTLNKIEKVYEKKLCDQFVITLALNKCIEFND